MYIASFTGGVIASRVTGDQRGSDRAAIAGQHGMDAAIDRRARGIQNRGIADPETRLGLRIDNFDLAERIARCADLLRVHIARKIVAAGPERLQRRRQMRFQFDEAADRRRSVLADRKPHPIGFFGDVARVERLHRYGHTVAALAALADLDKT